MGFLFDQYCRDGIAGVTRLTFALSDEVQHQSGKIEWFVIEFWSRCIPDSLALKRANVKMYDYDGELMSNCCGPVLLSSLTITSTANIKCSATSRTFTKSTLRTSQFSEPTLNPYPTKLSVC